MGGGWRITGRPRGFSLVELTLVVAILAVVTAMALPRFANSLTRYRLDAAARRIAADLELARQAAQQTSASRTVTFSPPNTYRLQNVKALDSQATDYDVDLRLEPYHAQIVSADFNGDAVVVFNGHGVPDSGGTVVIQVGTDQKTIVLDPDTGQASIP